MKENQREKALKILQSETGAFEEDSRLRDDTLDAMIGYAEIRRLEVKYANLRPNYIEWLACKVLGIEADSDIELINIELYNEFNTDIGDFTKLINRLHSVKTTA